MNYILLPSLQHAAAVRTASLLYSDCKIRNWIGNEENDRRQRQVIEKKVDEKLSSLLSVYPRKTVCEVFYNMNGQVTWWKKDHEFLLESIGGCFCTYLCWMMDGTIDRIRTSKKMVANENINPGIRFIMACIYFLEDEVLDLWKKYEEIVSNLTAKDGTNIAVRFWVEWLKIKDAQHWSEMIDEYFRNHRSCPGDIPTSVSCFYHLLSRQSKQHIDLMDTGKVHTVDFRMCVTKMIEKDRIELFRSKSAMALFFCFRWPFRSLFIRMAKEVIGYLRAIEFQNLLFLMITHYLLEGDEDFQILEAFWQMSPALFKEEAKENESILELIEECLGSETLPENFKEILIGFLL